MYAFKITGAGVRAFMQKLLREDAFAGFEARCVDITSFTRFQISGARAVQPAEGEGVGSYCAWRELQPFAFSMVKGDKPPRLMKLTFSLPPSEASELNKNAAACFLNIVYENGEVLCTTATQEKTFTMDGQVDAAWEDYIKGFVKRHKFDIILD